MSSTGDTPQELSWHAWDPAGVNPTLWDQPLHNSLYSVVVAKCHSHSVWEAILPTDMPTAFKAQLQEGTQNPNKGLLEYSAQETTTLGLTEHLLHKGAIPRPEDVADLSNT